MNSVAPAPRSPQQDLPNRKCVCGASECEVHRPTCPVWMSNEAERGPLRCERCYGKFRSLTNERCGVCHYWRSRLLPYGVVKTNT